MYSFAERAQQLKRWVIDAFQDDEDNADIEYAIAKLVRGRPDPDGADDGYILRVLQHPNLPIHSAYTVLTLLSRRRGVGGVGADTSAADQAFLGEMVRFLVQVEESPLQLCMMAYSALFPPPDLPRADLVLGGSQVAEALLRGDNHSKQKAARLVVRLHELYEEREPLAQVTEKVAEWFLGADDLPALVAFQRLVRRKGTGNMVQVREKLPVVSALDFGWIYESMVEDAARRQAAETRAEAEQIVGLLGWGDQEGRGTDAGAREGSDADARLGSWSGSGDDDDDGAHVGRNMRESERVLEKMGWQKMPLDQLRFVSSANDARAYAERRQAAEAEESSGVGVDGGDGVAGLAEEGPRDGAGAGRAPVGVNGAGCDNECGCGTAQRWAPIEERLTGSSSVCEELKKEIEAHLIGQARNRAEVQQIMARLGRGLGRDDDGAHAGATGTETEPRTGPSEDGAAPKIGFYRDGRPLPSDIFRKQQRLLKRGIILAVPSPWARG
jgi:hypothetical protein